MFISDWMSSWGYSHLFVTNEIIHVGTKKQVRGSEEWFDVRF